MPICHQISDFEISQHKNGNTRILISGDTLYHNLLLDAFPEYSFSPAWQDQFHRFDWGCFINGITQHQRKTVSNFLNRLKQVIYVQDTLDQSFALDYYTKSIYGRTEVGEIIYQVKYAGQQADTSSIVNGFMDFINIHPSYKRVDCVVSVPSSGKGTSIPNYFAQEISNRLEVPNHSRVITKVRKTESMKNIDILDNTFAKNEGIEGF